MKVSLKKALILKFIEVKENQDQAQTISDFNRVVVRKNLESIIIRVFSSSNKQVLLDIQCTFESRLSSSLRKYIESTFEGSYDMIFIYINT